MNTHTEIAEKYCQILKAFGPNSTEVKRAALILAAEDADAEIIGKLDAILGPAIRLHRQE